MAVAEVLSVASKLVDNSRDQDPQLPRSEPTRSPIHRLLFAVAVLAIECVAVSRMVHLWLALHRIIAALIVLLPALVFFSRPALRASHLHTAPIRPRFALLHALVLTLIFTEQVRLNHFPPPYSLAALGAYLVWCGIILLLILSLAAALFPLRLLLKTLHPAAWLLASLASIAAMSARTLSYALWNARHGYFTQLLQSVTFNSVDGLLRLFYTDVVSVPKLFILGTTRFDVYIASACSGVEGLGLVLVFTLGWLVFTRRELRLNRALLLIPAALGISWLLNIARIAALIALGTAGHAETALNGFHSEAGWILFNAVAFTFLLAAEHLPWLRRDASDTTPSATFFERNPAEPYLIPFLAVLLISILSRTASSHAELLYPLRLAAALLALWWYRADYRRLNWSFGWLGPLAGAAVFALWLALSRLPFIGAASNTLASDLAHLPHWQRLTWILLRTVSAVFTVPIIEELAFRGYIARRVQSSDVDSISFARLSITAMLISSIAFGAMHGRMWIAAILSGAVFAFVAKIRNRFGEAVAAHATANLLIAIWVLTRSDYSLW